MTNLGTALDAGNDDGVMIAAKPKDNSDKGRMDEVPMEKIRIYLEENDNIPPTGQFFSANGRTALLRPGEEADVPMWIVNVLNDAVEQIAQVDPVTRQVVGYRPRLRFPYRVIREARNAA